MRATRPPVGYPDCFGEHDTCLEDSCIWEAECEELYLELVGEDYEAEDLEEPG